MPDKAKEEAQDRANTEAMVTATTPVPMDVSTIGTTVGFVPQPSPTAMEQSTASKVGDVLLGVVQGTGTVVFNAVKFAVLNALTLGGYGTYTIGKGLWDSVQKEGVVGALKWASVLYPLVKPAMDAYQAAQQGKYRKAGAAGATAAILGALRWPGPARRLRLPRTARSRRRLRRRRQAKQRLRKPKLLPIWRSFAGSSGFDAHHGLGRRGEAGRKDQ